MKYTAPGVPDLYQGGEIWDLSLVDPDNRRPVDYEFRRGLLEEIRQMSEETAASQVMQRADDGMPKLWTVYKALQLRRGRPECFGAEAAYTPLDVEGSKQDHVIAYLRGDGVVTVVPRLTVKVAGAWKDTSVRLPDGRWRNCLTGAATEGGIVPMRTLLKDFPVALLEREG
jgi:(1->4)-alpha-D-glucan 1-alpha-D-glucosylmutase